MRVLLCDARKAKGWTQTQLAAAAGLTQGTISGIEGGENCSLPTLARLARALGVPAGDLLEEDGASPASDVAVT